MSKSSLGRQLQMAAGFDELEAFSRRLNSSLQIDVVCQVLADGARELLGAQRCAIFLLDQRTGAVRCLSARGVSSEYIAAVEATYRTLPGGQLLQQRFLIVEDVRTDPRMASMRKLVENNGFVSMLLVALRHQDAPLGAVAVYYDEQQHFDAALLALAQTLANQAAIALANAQSHALAQQRVAELEKLRQAAVEINGQPDLPSTLNAIVRWAARLLGVRAAAVYLYDPDRQEIEVKGVYNASESYLGRRMRVGEGLSGRVFLTRQAELIGDYRSWELASPVWHDVTYGTVLAEPLVYSDNPVGVLDFMDDAKHRALDEDAMRVAGLFASQAAAALTSALSLAESRRRADRLMALQRVTASVTAALNLNAVLQSVVEDLCSTFGYTLASVHRVQGDNLVLEAVAGLAIQDVEAIVTPGTQGIIGRAARHSATQYVTDVSRDADFVSVKPGVLAEAAAPILLGGRVWGVLNVEASEWAALSAADVPLLDLFCQQIAVAIRNAGNFAEIEQLFQAVAQRAVENERLRKFNENLVRSVEAGILLERADDTIQYVNPRLCAMVGYRETELVGQSTAILLSPEMDALVDRKAAGRRLGEIGRYEAALLHRAGHEIPVLVSATPLFEEGIFAGTLTAFTDITQRKRTERTLLALNTAAAAVRQAVEPQQVYETIGEEVRKLGLSLIVFSYYPAQRALLVEHASLLGQLQEIWLAANQAQEAEDIILSLESVPDFAGPILAGKAEYFVSAAETVSVTAVEQVGVARELLSRALAHQSAVIAPVISQQQVTGVFLVLGDDLSEEDLPAFEAFANQTSAALDNARLFSAERRERLRAETLGRVAGILNSSLELDQALHQVMQQLRSLLSYDNSALFLMQDSHMVCQLADGVDADWWLDKSLSVDGYPLLQEMQATLQTILVPDTRLDSRWIGSPRTAHLASFIAAPLIADGQLVGMLSVDKAQHGFYSGESQQLIAAFANQISVAIQRAWHLNDARQHLRELSSLVQASAALAEAFDLAAVLDVVLHNTCELLDAQRGAIALVKSPGRQLDVVAERGHSPDFIEHVNRAGLCLPDVIEPEPCLRPPILLAPVAELNQPPAVVICIPLRLAGQLIGLIEVDHSALDAPQRRLLMAVADLAAAAIDKAQLYQDTARAYQELRELDRLKDEFVQNVSHELRTPLTFVKGYIEYLLAGYAGELNSNQRQALEIVLDRSDAIVRLVNDIVSLKQAELQEMDLHPVALEQIATACVEGSRAAAEQAGIDLRLNYPPGLPPVYGDATRLGQVFDNLLGNAIKFSPNGGSIKVRLSPLGNMVQVEISDTGVGIPADRIDQIWKRFFQIDGASTRRFAGAGLGLAIVKSIIDAHFGHIWVESKLGQGSIFCFTLPQYIGRD